MKEVSDQESFMINQTHFRTDSMILKQTSMFMISRLYQSTNSAQLKAKISLFINRETPKYEGDLVVYRAFLEVQRVERIRLKIDKLEEWRSPSHHKSICKGLVISSAYWITHPSGKIVRAKGHGERLVMGSHGWRVEFGANSFEVGVAVDRARLAIKSIFERQIENAKSVTKVQAISKLSDILPNCISNYKGALYDNYSNTDGWLTFGTQGIKPSAGGRYFAAEAGID